MRRSTRTASKSQPIKEDPPKKSAKKGKAKKENSPSPDKSLERKPSKKVKKSTSQDIDKEPVKKEPVKKEPAKKTEEMKKVKMSGKAPVDSYFSKQSQGVVVQHLGVTYASTLNQTNIGNNNNKFYILQIIQTNPGEYYFFCRWGRVGVSGQTSEMLTGSLDNAIRLYNSKLKDKTKSGSYRIVQMNYQNEEEEEEEDEQKNEKKEQQPETKSDLNQRVQQLIRLIFDMKMMNNHMKEIGYDAQKMPLGKLSKSAIEKGYIALNSLLDEVKNKSRHEKLQQYSNDFYSYIPHDFGFMKMQMFILNSQKKIKQKLEMLQSLQDIQVYTNILKQGKISDINEIDSNYFKLKTDVEPLDKNSETYKALIKYVKNTHATTHSSYGLEVLDIYELNKEQDNVRYTKDIHNKQLLWHGSRLTNYVGILSQGLRIAPPQAPVTGYMFGKGVYFADMVSKSANYCCTNKMNNVGLMLLCETALGDMSEKFGADYYASNLPPGKSSTKGLGRTAPKQGQYFGDVWVPNGVGVPSGVNHTALLYNEFIVYDVAQIKLKYLFKMRFDYR